MALAQQKHDVTAARLAGMVMPAGAPWANAARADALARVQAAGLPHARDEYWRYTSPALLLDGAAPQVSPRDADPVYFAASDAITLVFVDGVFDAAQSSDLAQTGLEITSLANALQTDIHWARDLFGTLESRGQVPVARPFAALNTAFAADGVVLRASAPVARPVHLIYRQRDAGADAMLHHLVRVDAGASLTLLETGPAAARMASCIEVDVAADAAFHHIRAQGNTPGRVALTHCFTRLAARSLFKSFTLTLNGRLTRNECVIELTGDDASAHVAGACVGDGADFHHDDTVFITHDAVNCESRQVFKKVLRRGAVGVFQGKILVKAGAQKTDGYQISQSLLLDEDSQFLAKPELEIYADDVACSHGSTSGAIDEDALFYLRSRGVPLADARNLLTLSFLAEALAEIADQDLAADLQDQLASWLARHR